MFVDFFKKPVYWGRGVSRLAQNRKNCMLYMQKNFIGSSLELHMNFIESILKVGFGEVYQKFK